MNKVYCNNCSAYRYDDDGYLRCIPDSFFNKYTGKQIEKSLYSVDENKEGDCKHYKRKWWKFWLKRK